MPNRVQPAGVRRHARTEPMPRQPDAAQMTTAGRTATKAPKADTDSGSALELHLDASLRASGLPPFVREHRFHPTRRWRLDFAWPSAKLGVEIEGGIYSRGRHGRGSGIAADIEKSNALTLLGWRLLRFHGDQVRSGQAVETIRQALTEGTP